MAAPSTRDTPAPGQLLSRPWADEDKRSLSATLKRAVHKPAGLGWFVLQRQRNHPGLTLLALLGVVLAVGLVASATFFADGVERAILQQKLDAFSAMTGRPPFSTSVYVFPSARRPLSLQDAEGLAGHVGATLAGEVGLPVKHLGVRVESGMMMLQPAEGSTLYGDQALLDSVDVVYVADVAPHIDITAGEPMDESPSGEMMDVWVHARLAEDMGLHVGDPLKVGRTVAEAGIPLRVRGFWQATDPTEPFWFNNPDETLKKALLVRRQDYIDFVQPVLPAKTRYVNWHVILDERKVLPERARQYIAGFERGLGVLNKFIPGAELNAPPLDPLDEFVTRETTLTILLLGFNVPAFGFLLYFLMLTSSIIARWQQRDTAILSSRGLSTSYILGITFLDELLLFLLGLPLGVACGMLLARLMGNTASFLSFVHRTPLPVSVRGINWVTILLALAISLLARLVPAAQAARDSIVQQERERARPMRGPFWYRNYLDLLLILPTAYAYRQLTYRGTLAMLVQDQPEEMFRDPLLILVPALFILSAALITLRVFPLVMRLVDVFAGMLPWATPHLALRSLSRGSIGYINPLLLIIVSLALGVYSLSLANSLDQWLVDRMYYRVGSDVAFTPTPLNAQPGEEVIDGAWIPLPDRFRELPGVEAATPVGDYGIRIRVPGQDDVHGRFLAVDRTTFPTASWYRWDLSEESLGALMNRLALVPDGILVPERVLAETPLRIGDRLSLRVSVNSSISTSTSFTVAGTYKYFPTVYDEELVFIGSLEYLTILTGVPLPHDIWLRTAPGVDGESVLDAMPQLGISVDPLRHYDAKGLVAEERAKTERIGVFGTLSVGFMAAVVMAAMGLMTYSYASLRERLFRFAVFRAIGLRRWQIIGQVIAEYALLTAIGALAGAAIGIAASQFFVPFFRVTGEQGIPLPPLLPIVAYEDIVRLVAVFAPAMILVESVVIARALSWRQFRLLRTQGE